MLLLKFDHVLVSQCGHVQNGLEVQLSNQVLHDIVLEVLVFLVSVNDVTQDTLLALVDEHQEVNGLLVGFFGTLDILVSWNG